MAVVQSPKDSLEHPDAEKNPEIQKKADSESADSKEVKEEYPGSIQLFFITIAVIFSIFLSALDQVSVQRPLKKSQLEIGNLTYICKNRLSLVLPFPKSQTSFTMSTRCHGLDLLTS